MKIFVRCKRTWKTIELDVLATDTVESVKQQSLKSGMPLPPGHKADPFLCFRRMLRYGIKQHNALFNILFHTQGFNLDAGLLGHRTLSDYNIAKESILDFYPCDLMQIFYRNLVGRTVTLEVLPDETVANVKAQIERIEEICPRDYRLIYAGKLKRNVPQIPRD